MFAVAAKPEQIGDDQLRAAAGAGAGNGIADSLSSTRPDPCRQPNVTSTP